MEVILLEKVGKLGALGDRVTVKGGYARNFLLPQGRAVLANEANIAEFEARRAELEAKMTEVLNAAQARADQLTALEAVTIQAPAGDEGKLFGSVGTRDIADAVSAAGVAVTKAEVKLPTGTLRELGEYDIDVQLHAEVTTTVKLVIAAE